MTMNEFATRIKEKTGHPPQRSGSGYKCHCPAHEDKNPSLSVSQGDKGILLHCHKGCPPEDIVAELGLKMADLFWEPLKARPGRNDNGAPQPARCAVTAKPSAPVAPKPDPARVKPGSGPLRLIDTYDYRDEGGKLVFQVCRFEGKEFRQRRPDPNGKNGWTWKTKGIRRVLFRLPELLAAVKSGKTVFIAEGEKDVLALVKQGFEATSHPGGADNTGSKWLASYNEPLRGASVVVIADKDDTGRPHAAAVAAKLKPVAKSVKVLELPDVEGKAVKDAHDFFANGGTPDRLNQLAAQAPEYGTAAAAEVLPPPFYYHNEKGDYWRKMPDGSFAKTNEENLKRHLRFGGFRASEFEGPYGVTKWESALVRCQNENAVDHVICLAGHKPGIYRTEDGRRIMIPRCPAILPPVPGPTDNFDSFFTEFFGQEQTQYALAWLKLALEDLQSFDPERWRHHQMLALVGKPNCGKSFFQGIVSLLLGGREADPYLWMVQKTDFNEDLAEAEHWKMEDKNAHRDAKSRVNFGGAIKQATVSHTLAVHGKGKKQILLTSFRRCTISINDDPEYITVLPMLDSSVADKITILKCHAATMLPDWKENRARFAKELPAFVHFLLKGFKIPPDLQHGRFGVKTYHSPEVIELLQQFETHLQLLEVIDAAIFGGPDPLAVWTGSSTELQKELCSGSYDAKARQLLNYSTACGVLLSKLAEARPDRVSKTRVKGNHKWTITAPR